ncbi:MAG: hypothetical protein WAV38_36405 [Xanthobacteraceae bacterium]
MRCERSEPRRTTAPAPRPHPSRTALPGKPDFVFPGRNKIIFVHGCYWHGHGCSVGGTGAKSNQAYWEPKIAGN